MGKAVARARREGLIRTYRGRGMFVNRRPPPSSPPQDARVPEDLDPAWLRARKRIDGDIRNGTYPPGTPLPSVKELSDRYGVSYVNIRDALASLAQQNRLVRHKRGYRVYEFGYHSSRPTIVFIGLTDKQDILSVLSTYASDIVRSFESQLIRANIQFEVVGYYELVGGAGRRISLPRLERDRTILGYVVYAQRLRTEDTSRLLGMLQQTGKPVSVLDVSHVMTDWTPVRRNPCFRSFYYWGGGRGGELVGEHVLSLGHRKAAFFTPVDDQRPISPTWHRLQGLRHAFTNAGLPDGVTHVFSDRFANDEDMRRYFEGRFPVSDLIALTDTFIETVNRSQPIPHSPFAPGDLSYPTNRLYLNFVLEPCFETALADRSLTAWIGFSDTVALLAMSFLKSKGVRVPGDITVVGFDDSVEAFGFDLSSYSFNCEGMVTEALDHIIRFRRERRRPEPFHEVPGRVMVRGTSGPAGNGH